MTMTPDSFLIIQHAENCPPGHILDYAPHATVLRMWEDPSALRTMALGQTPLPSAVVVLGGTESAYADHAWPWLSDVRAILRRCYEESVPALGICLGMQLTAVAGGGEVSVSADQGSEVGLTQIFWNGAQTDPLVRALAADEWAYADHADAVTLLPAGAAALARSDKYTHVMRWGSIIGVQYHPEVNSDIVRAWLAKDPPPNAQQILDEYEDAAPELAQHCQRLCETVFGAHSSAH